MNTKPHLRLVGLICLLFVLASAQEKPKKCHPAITDSKKLTGTIRVNDRETIEIVGKATYTVTALNSDESLAGTFVFVFAETGRQKIAQAMNKELSEIPASIDQQEVIAQFAKLTECPVLQFDLPAMVLEIAGAKMQLKRFTLNLKESDDEPTLILCTLARQITGGIGRRLNRQALNQRLNCQEEKD